MTKSIKKKLKNTGALKENCPAEKKKTIEKSWREKEGVCGKGFFVKFS